MTQKKIITEAQGVIGYNAGSWGRRPKLFSIIIIDSTLRYMTIFVASTLIFQHMDSVISMYCVAVLEIA